MFPLCSDSLVEHSNLKILTEFCFFSEVTEEIERAEGLIKDAEHCKLLVSSLHDTAAPRELAQCPVQQKIADIAADLETFITDHIGRCVGSMLDTAAERCPTVLAPHSRNLEDLRTLAETKAGHAIIARLSDFL